jgi:hypothetical protein
MPEPENTPVAEEVEVQGEEEEPTPEEIEVVAHSDEELPCGGFACVGFGSD